MNILSEKLIGEGGDETLLSNLLSQSGPTGNQIKKGTADWLDGGNARIILRNEYLGHHTSRFNIEWETFKHSIKHYARFFEFDCDGSHRENSLEVIGELLHKMNFTLAEGTLLWRVRIGEGQLSTSAQDLQKDVGLQPIEKSKHSRMSPAGMSFQF